MIQVGYEIRTGKRVSIPLGHTIILGQTQKSGKTTTLEAMALRGGVKAVAFITKRGERSFRLSHTVPPYYSETSETQPYWKFVISIIESAQDVKLGFREKGWIMELCSASSVSVSTENAAGKRKRDTHSWKEPKTLRDVLANAELALKHSKGISKMICRQLVEYLKIAVPEIEKAKLSNTIELKAGINVMDISKLSMNVQALIIRSVVEWVYLRCKNTVVIIPEAWKFLPEYHTTPVSAPVQELIRQGAVIGNFVWIDLQDLRGIQKMLLRSIQVWLFGVQREKNEVENTLRSMPTPEVKPTAQEMMQLKIGEFLVAYDTELYRCYVQPAGMEDVHAQAIARGEEKPESWTQIARSLDAEKVLDEDGRIGAADGPEVGRNSQDANGTGTHALPLKAGDVSAGDVRGGAGAPHASRAQKESPQKANLAHEKPVGSADDARAVAQLDQPAAGSPRAAEGDAPGVDQDGDREDAMWKETHETFVKEVHQPLVEAHDALAKRVLHLEERIRVSEAAGETVLHAPAGNGTPPVGVLITPENVDLEAVYRYIIDRATREAPPALLRVVMQRPELKIQRELRTIDQDAGTLKGALAILIAEKFFDGVREFVDVRRECIRRGFLSNKAPNQQISTSLQSLVELGFLTKEGDCFQAVAGMKVNIVEARA